MKTSLLLLTDSWVISLVLFLAMFVCILLGIAAGRRRKKHLEARGVKEEGAETAYLTGLLFFLLAFTFGMSGSRYDTRRVVVVEEANNIGTALLRADLYSPEERLLFRKDFKDYVEARIAYFKAGHNPDKILEADQVSQSISAKLWMRATKLSFDQANYSATLLMIPALNAMIDITNTRKTGELAKVPESIMWMLFSLACICAFFSGYASSLKGSIDWLLAIGFCLLISIVVFFTLDLDRPRRGFVTLDTPNQAIIDLRNSFK